MVLLDPAGLTSFSLREMGAGGLEVMSFAINLRAQLLQVQSTLSKPVT